MCLFCKIVRREVLCEVVLEDDEVLAFKDVRPVAPSHALVIPRRHMTSIQESKSEDQALLGRLMLAAREVAEKLDLDRSGYRLVINTGPDGGQSVFHLHVHVLGGRALAWPPG
jgi:histidine triad (HIT) family protein